MDKWEKYIKYLARTLQSEDAEQELRITSLRAKAQYNSSKNMKEKTWIVKLLKQRAYDLLVKESRNREDLTETGEMQHLYYQEPIFDEEIEVEDLKNKMIENLIKIGTLRDIIIAELLFSGEKPAEIAKSLSINPAIVSATRLKLQVLYSLLLDLPLRCADKAAVKLHARYKAKLHIKGVRI